MRDALAASQCSGCLPDPSREAYAFVTWGSKKADGSLGGLRAAVASIRLHDTTRDIVVLDVVEDEMASVRHRSSRSRSDSGCVVWPYRRFRRRHACVTASLPFGNARSCARSCCSKVRSRDASEGRTASQRQLPASGPAARARKDVQQVPRLGLARAWVHASPVTGR